MTSCNSVWARCNHTELYQVARDAGLPAVPSDSPEKLIALLEGERTTGEVHEIDRWRNAIMVFVNDFWPKLQSQIECPAKSREPRACYGCPDQQVIACLVKNEPLKHYIEIRRK